MVDAGGLRVEHHAESSKHAAGCERTEPVLPNITLGQRAVVSAWRAGDGRRGAVEVVVYSITPYNVIEC